MSQDSDIAKIIKNAQAQGFRYSKTSTGHHQLYAPNGHDIITHSGTPSDNRGFYNFLADLKRAGYMELQTLADFIPKKEPSKKEDEPQKQKLTINQYVVDLLTRHADGMNFPDIKAYIKSVRPDIGDSATSGSLTVLTQKGVLKRMAPGFYKLGDKKLGVERPPRMKHKKLTKEEPETVVSKVEKTSVDKDLRALDVALNDALVALTKIDTIAQKMKAKLARFAKIQELLK